MGQGLSITAADALICIKSSYSTANDQAMAILAGLIMPIPQKPGRSMADLAAPGRIASPLREHDLAEDMITQYQAGAQQRVGG
jgi:hypothetical protein